MTTTVHRREIAQRNIATERDITRELLAMAPGESKVVRGVLVSRRVAVPTCFQCGDSLGSAGGLSIIIRVRQEAMVNA